MSYTLPQYYTKIGEEKAGRFELVMLTSYAVDGDRRNLKVLYVCKSLDGYLSEAFEWSDLGKTWEIDYDYEPTRGCEKENSVPTVIS